MTKKRKQRRQISPFGLSFLDAISCGFGAIIMLLVLTKIGEPQVIEQTREDLDAQIAKLQAELETIQGETRVLNRELTTKQQQISQQKERIARLKAELARIQSQYTAGKQQAQIQEILNQRMLAAQQKLTDEMKRLAAQQPQPKPGNPIAGIPVDSEYIIFIIDTSGSMKQFAWSLMLRKMRQTLDIYPQVKGMQVMNDMGQYLFPSYRGRWIPDTPGRRNALISALGSWNAFSNSSPVEGIQQAIRQFASNQKKVSLYVFGDEFTGPSIQNILETVQAINSKDAEGKPRVRIHAVGFPTVFSSLAVSDATGVRFATLMRTLCRENGGTFVALNGLR